MPTTRSALIAGQDASEGCTFILTASTGSAQHKRRSMRPGHGHWNVLLRAIMLLASLFGAGAIALVSLDSPTSVALVNTPDTPLMQRSLPAPAVVHSPSSTALLTDLEPRQAPRPPAPYQPYGYMLTAQRCGPFTIFHGTWCSTAYYDVRGYVTRRHWPNSPASSDMSYDDHCAEGYLCKPHVKSDLRPGEWNLQSNVPPPQVRCVPDRWHWSRKLTKHFRRTPPDGGGGGGWGGTRQHFSSGSSSLQRSDSDGCVTMMCLWAIESLCDGDCGGSDAGDCDSKCDNIVDLGSGTFSALLLGPDSSVLDTGVSSFYATADGGRICHADPHSAAPYSEHACMPDADVRIGKASKLVVSMMLSEPAPMGSYIAWDWLELPKMA